MKRLSFDLLTCFILQIVKCSFAALNTAPMRPPKQPIQQKTGSSQMLKLEASPLFPRVVPKKKQERLGETYPQNKIL